MQVGDLVKYKPHLTDNNKSEIGIVIDTQSLGLRMLIEWNNGVRQWRHINVLEAICK